MLSSQDVPKDNLLCQNLCTFQKDTHNKIIRERGKVSYRSSVVEANCRIEGNVNSKHMK